MERKLTKKSFASMHDLILDAELNIRQGSLSEGLALNLLIGQIIAKVVLSLVLVPFLITGGVAFARWLDRR